MRAAGDLLARALERRGACRVLDRDERPWASATFVGAQHRLRLAVEGADFLDGIEEEEFDLGEYLLADIVVVARAWVGEEWLVEIEALTIEDWRDPEPASAQAEKRERRRMWPWSAPCAGVEDGWAEPDMPTTCGTKRAFVPLAAA